MKKLCFSFLFIGLFIFEGYSQFSQINGTTPVLNSEFGTVMKRTAKTGIGEFPSSTGPTSLFQVRAVTDSLFNQISQVETGTFGLFNSTSKWLGLGVGNPGGTPEPYGLAIVDSTHLGFYNLIDENSKTNLIASFGQNASENENRFIIRSYFGTNGTSHDDLMIASPLRGIGVNAEPLSTFWVDSRNSDKNLVKAIAILGRQPLYDVNTSSFTSIQSASAIGNQANKWLDSVGIAVEGFRAQIPDFLPPNLGVGTATNLQVVNNPFGFIDAASFAPPGLEYAELTWQDLNTDSVLSTDCNVLAFDDAEAFDKFFISFRNNNNVDPFGVGNKLPVMTFQGNGRVGIATIQPTSGTCDKRDIFLDVNGGIVSSGSLVSSDRRFKKDIQPIANGLELVRKINGRTYTFNHEAFPDRHFSKGNQFGFIAQELEEVVPEVTLLNSDGFYAVDYPCSSPYSQRPSKSRMRP